MDLRVQFVVGGLPLDIIDKLYEDIKKKYDQVKVSDKTWKIKFLATGKFTEPNLEINTNEQEQAEQDEEKEEDFIPKTENFGAARIELNIYEVEPEKRYIVALDKKEGFIQTFERVVEEIKKDFEN